MAQQVEYDGLTKLVQAWNASIGTLSYSRKAIHEGLATQLLSQVRQNIGGTGKVQSWQDAYSGSLGGYAAVRAKAKTSYNGYAVGAVTNAIENGHKQAQGMYVHALGKRLTASNVEGKHFYADAKTQAQSIGQTYAQKLAAQVAAELESAL